MPDGAPTQRPTIESATSLWSRRTRRADAQLLHLPIEVRPLDAQVTRGTRQAARIGGEPIENVLPLETRARLAQGQSRPILGNPDPRDLEGVHGVLMGYDLTGDQHHQPLHQVPELTHVAVPRELHQEVDRPRRETLRPEAVLHGRQPKEVLRKLRDVLAA